MFATQITETDTFSQTVTDTQARYTRDAKAAKALVDNAIGHYVTDGGATGGKLADWRDVTLYIGSTSVVTITTARA